MGIDHIWSTSVPLLQKIQAEKKNFPTRIHKNPLKKIELGIQMDCWNMKSSIKVINIKHKWQK